MISESEALVEESWTWGDGGVGRYRPLLFLDPGEQLDTSRNSRQGQQEVESQ